MNIAQHVEVGARCFPARLALRFEGMTYSYEQLNSASNRAAGGFAQLGIGRGDRVAICLPNSAAFIIAYLATQKLGAIAVTINSSLKVAELEFIIKDSMAQLLITTAALYADLATMAAPSLQQVVLVEGERAGTDSFDSLLRQAATQDESAVMAAIDPAALLYTSGTTGFPKGALLSHGALISATETAVATFDLRPEDRVLLALSMFHSFAQTAALLPCFAAGATLILHRQFELEPVLRSIREEAATIFFGVPTLYILLQAQAAPQQLGSLRRYISAGATLPIEVARKWQESYGTAINEGYGLTEICLGSYNHAAPAKAGSVGKPLVGVRIRVVDEIGEEVAPGELGEVTIQTPSVMLGYWNRPDATAAVLRDGWFHSGDIGRVDEDGYYYIVDRIKDMVNVGGVKVYPSEVEQLLYQHPAVHEAAVYGVPEALLGEQVHAAIVLKADQMVSAQAMIDFCRQHLAEYKAPAVIHFVDQLPKNRSGKILKRSLREQLAHSATAPAAPQTTRSLAQLPQKASATRADVARMAQWISAWLADQLAMTLEQIEGNQPFADYGMSSVMAVNLAGALSDWLGQPIPAVLLWNFPTVDTLAEHVAGELLAPPVEPNSVTQTNGFKNERTHAGAEAADYAIALIGIGCRFPGGADTPEKFWQLLRNGVDTVQPIPGSRWSVDGYYDPVPNTPGKMYVRAGHFLDQIDHFDAPFFGISPVEAAAIDPQQRLLLEVAWEALEEANLVPAHLHGSRTGVYIGAFWDDYSAQHLYNAPTEQIDSYSVLSNLRGMMAGRLAYVLGLHGPAMQLDTACSSSLLAVHLACQALRTGECDLALAGGVNLVLTPEQVIGLCHMGAVSPDGRCKTFAAEADGFGIGEGAGVVVLKRLADALRDGDQVRAVIRGSAVNHDGASNGLTAPNGLAQEALLRQALENAAVHPAQIQYVETHGTGTVLGDPIEVQALSHVLSQGRQSPLLLGSVKTNIGHLSAAAGIASLIKVVLALGAGEIPASLHLRTPNPYIPWATTPLAIPTETIAWPVASVDSGESRGERRLAGVSSFGLTGTNVHLIVEAPPQQQQTPDVPLPSQANDYARLNATYNGNGNGNGAPLYAHTNGHSRVRSLSALGTGDRPYHLLPLSAKSKQALVAQIAQVEEWLATASVDNDETLWANICYTAATSRSHFEQRLAIVAADAVTARTKLRQARMDADGPGRQRGTKRNTTARIAFLFAGQGPQYLNMGRQLYEMQPLFRRTLVDCAAILQPYLDQPLTEILYGANQAQADALLNKATYAQPALFAIEYALATLWRSWGIEPTVMMGHSLGEYAAACLAGVFSLEDGLHLVATRGRLMQEVAPQGRMVAVLAHEATVRQLLAPYAETVSLAAINTPQSVVIAGNTAAVAAATQTLHHAGIETRALKIHVASHSPLMEPILEQFAAVARRVSYHPPRLQLVSNVTGALADEQIATPEYWCRHLREPVQFAQGMATLADLGINTFLETGPKATLIGLGQQGLAADETRCWLHSIHPKREEWLQMLESLSALYCRGFTVDWQRFDQAYPRAKVSLPRYPFQRQRHWLDVQPKPVTHPQAPQEPALHPLLGRQIASALAARNRELLFEQRLDLTTQPYLADHAIFAQPLLPGAAYLEMILAAGAERWQRSPLVIEECSIQQGLFLPLADPATPPAYGQRPGVTLQTVLSPADGGCLWQIYSLADGAQPDAWQLHAAGKVRPTQEETRRALLDLATVRARCQTAIDGATHAQQLRDQGIHFGPAFQALTELFVGEGEALGAIVLPVAVRSSGDAYQLHPVLLDAALRVSSALMPATTDPYLPFAVEQLHFYPYNNFQRQSKLWSYVQKRADQIATPDSLHVDLTLVDESGQVVAQLTNFVLRRAKRQALLAHQQRLDWLYELSWKPVSRGTTSAFAQEAGRWLILADRQGYGADLAARLEAKGEQCCVLYHDADGAPTVTVEAFQRHLSLRGESNPGNLGPKLCGVVFLWGLDTFDATDEAIPTAARQLSIAALHLVQAILQSGESPRLWVVTQAAVGHDVPRVQMQQAPLWGLARTIQAEQPELACTAVDLTATIDLTATVNPAALFEEVWFADEEQQLLLRGTERLAARLVRHKGQRVRPLALSPEASYLITGGLGGLGLQVAQWLVAQGARALLLAGRRGVTTAEAAVAIRAMEEAGAQIVVLQADIANRADVRRLLAASQAVGPLRGIIHAAGVIDDGILLRQSATRFAAVMAPKIDGTWHLHTLTQALPLDFFVCFSSVAALLGNSGQGNYAAANAFMDALAQRRQQEGRPALSINWGGWAEVGLAAELVKQTAATGLGEIAPTQGVDLLGLLLTHAAAQVGVLPIDWPKFQENPASRALSPLLAELVKPRTTERGTATMRRQLAPLTAVARAALVKGHVQEVVTNLLGVTPADQESFFLFGLDSLLSIQLANRLAAAWEIALPATLAFKENTIAELTEFLINRLDDGAATTATGSVTTGSVANGQKNLAGSTNSTQSKSAESYPQLYNQQECFVWHETVVNKASLHIQQSIYIHSAVDVHCLEAALQALVARHEALRTVYSRDNEELLQRILPTHSVDFAEVDVQNQPWSALAESILATAQQPFDLAHGPLVRGRLFSRTATDNLLLLVVHHIAADATALSVIVNELWPLYEALDTGKAFSLPPVTRSWSNFVDRQTALLRGVEGERLWRYWQEQMAETPARLKLPTDYPYPAEDSHKGRPCYFELDMALTERLRGLARREGCTLYMVLMTGFQLLLHRYTQQRDLMVAAHVANRNDDALAEVVGYLADTFPIRVQITEEATFQTVLKQVQTTLLGAMEHQGFPMRLLAERLGRQAHPTETALCQVWFTLLPLRLFQESGALFQPGAGPIHLGGLTLEAADLIPAWLGAWYDLEMILTEGEDVVFGTLVYKTDLFAEATVKRMIAEFIDLLKMVTDHPLLPVTPSVPCALAA